MGAESASKGEVELAKELAGRVAGKAESCVPTTPGQGLQVIDRRTIIYRRGATLWVNRLASECPGIDPLNPLVVETHGSQYCRGDHIRGLRPGNCIPGPLCFLGDFTPYKPSGR